MKKIIAVPVIVAAFIIAAFTTEAQTFYGLQTLSGSNSAPILFHFGTQSNVAPLNIQSQTLLVTNVLTNEQITVFYSPQVTGVTNPGTLPLTSLTTNFTGANGWTVFPTNWTFTIPGATYYPALSPWGTIQIVDTNFTSGTCTNGVGLQ